MASPGIFLRGSTFDAQGQEMDSYAIGERDANHNRFDNGGMVDNSQIEQLHPDVLVEDLSCTLYLKDTEYVPQDNTDSFSATVAYADEVWCCELSEEDQQQYNASRMVMLEGVDVSSLDGGVSGHTELQVSEALLSGGRLSVPSSAAVDMVPIAGRRRLDTPSTGILNALVLRVTYQNKNDAADLNQMKSSFFTDAVNLKERYEACSYGKLKIQPYSGTTTKGVSISGGAVNLNINTNPNQGKDKLEDAAQAAAASKLGNLRDQFHLVIYCMPPGSTGWSGYAYINGFESFYNGEACLSMSVQVHEVGHNLGLAHSGEVDEGAYGDKSGFLGISYNVQFEPKMCFNAVKNFQLGW